MFAAGRIWGQKILKFKPIARVMTPKRYAQVQEKFDKYGNWVFIRRPFPCPACVPPFFVTAGISRKVSYLRFILMDGLAALISVPVWIYLGEYGARNTDWLMKKMHSLQSGIFIVLGIGAVIVGWIWWKKHRHHTFFREKLHEKRAAKAKKQTNQ